ncbi:hypothetical protein URH17368_1988 [Alicyclobacillus hesperidum URH17-3-68]|nr:hypothetical protein URH17368_1988 [Alicyclobacillus hesperidum URH17-3-68]
MQWMKGIPSETHDLNVARNSGLSSDSPATTLRQYNHEVIWNDKSSGWK